MPWVPDRPALTKAPTAETGGHGPGCRHVGGPIRSAVRLRLTRLALVLAAASASAAADADAPGGMTVVAPPPAPPGAEASAADTSLRDDLHEITAGLRARAWKPKQAAANTTLVERGRQREFLRDVWCLEFAFKTPRMIDVDVPVADSKMRRKRVWYLLYRVRNVGGRRTVVDAADPSQRGTEKFEKPIRCLPHFVLESMEPLADDEGLASYRAYLDRIVPAALGPIATREKLRQRLFDSASMAESEIPPGDERWGVATWEDVDPRIDHFSIYVRGLTNALRWRLRPGAAIEPGDPPGSHTEETLQALRLDFWRPGDERGQPEEEIRVGFAGMFERMTLGARLLAATGRNSLDASQPVAGLAQLGLDWTKLLEPDAGDGGTSLLPLMTVIRAIRAIPSPADRGAAVKLAFGDLGPRAFEDLARALAAPTDAAREAERREALAAVGVDPATVADKPLDTLAALVRALEAQPFLADRRVLAVKLFGSAAPQVEWLARQVALARAIAALETIDGDRAAIAAGDALAAFEAVRPAIDAVADPARKREVLRGLFGPRGPGLYAKATAVHEGIDHAWVFRYETEEPGL